MTAADAGLRMDGLARRPGPWDLAALLLVAGLLVLVVIGMREMAGPLQGTDTVIDLSPAALPEYALRSSLRMLAAMGLSLVFTLTYATLAARSRRAGLVLVPLLDVLQSVPVLGYISFTVVFFLSLFPGSEMGAECAAIFAIFTSQAWNMAFSFYQSLRAVPADLEEVAKGFGFSPWQRFWTLDAPHAVPGLVWNMMMSMSGGWFFVVASEAITVGNETVTLPGIGSYLAQAIAMRDLGAVGWAVAAMLLVILACDLLLFRPLVVWSDRFRLDLTAPARMPESALVTLFRRTRWLRGLLHPLRAVGDRLAWLRLAPRRPRVPRPPVLPPRVVDGAWYLIVALSALYCGWVTIHYLSAGVGWADVGMASALGAITLLRVLVLTAAASLVWVPLGVMIGLRPELAARVQPLAQFLAAFPANLLFPVAVIAIVRFDLLPDIWLSPLMILGTQWYILFNVIAGTTAFPNDLREAADSFHIRGWQWWRQVMLPGIFPYYVTGAVTASGGAWNASIVAEAISWGDRQVTAHGLGSYIAAATGAGDYPRIVLGIAVMSLLVIACNRLLWRPLYDYAERRLRLG